jgi:catechol 2,3-dioxygenase-like lactoylglutathione lyase family enzyme
MRVLRLDHVQLAMPAGGEDLARAFYGNVLGLDEEPKAEPVRATGGVWFRGGEARVHLGVEPGFQPSRKAHPCFEVDSLDEALARCHAAGVAVSDAVRLEGIRRCFVVDPFGNRVELMQRAGG